LKIHQSFPTSPPSVSFPVPWQWAVNSGKSSPLWGHTVPGSHPDGGPGTVITIVLRAGDILVEPGHMMERVYQPSPMLPHFGCRVADNGHAGGEYRFPLGDQPDGWGTIRGLKKSPGLPAISQSVI
jgi:hypothetical protein